MDVMNGKYIDKYKRTALKKTAPEEKSGAVFEKSA